MQWFDQKDWIPAGAGYRWGRERSSEKRWIWVVYFYFFTWVLDRKVLFERESNIVVPIYAVNTIMNASDRVIYLTRHSNHFWILSLEELVSCSTVVGKFIVQHAFFFVNFLCPPPILWLTSRSLGLWTIPLDLESARGPGPESPRTLVGM